MKKIIVLFSILSFMTTIQAQEIIPLYKDNIPGAKLAPSDYIESTSTLRDGVTRTRNVTQPELIYFPVDKPNATAIIICPGGGYGLLSIDKEGFEVAKRFQALGFAAFVLKYRLPSDLIMEDKTIGPLQDALQAMYLVRKNANLWQINPRQIGIMGFSAGGHLASSLSVHYKDLKIQNTEKINLRPDFSIFIYPVISFGKFTHSGSLQNLLGDKSTQKQRDYFSSDLQINSKTPPAFLVHANDDKVVPVQNSIQYNLALIKHKVAAELHIYQAGGHGFGLHNKTTADDWFERLINWMKANKYAEL